MIEDHKEQLRAHLSTQTAEIRSSSRSRSSSLGNATPVSLHASNSSGSADDCTEVLPPLSDVAGLSTFSRAIAVDVEFKDISVKLPDSDRMILDQVSGMARHGQVLAIMGASGSGKTTLLNILCHRHELSTDGSESSSASGLLASGRILMNGQLSYRDLFRSYGAYVTQEDRLLRTFSPRESIAFTGALKLPKEFSAEERAQEVQNIINLLRLEKCSETPVGDFRHPGVSGGERKRTAIGIEMIGNPSILCLDEPTSGLDSYTALKVVQVLRDLAHNEGRTIILTIHQPSMEIFELFDSLLILSEGKTVYFGSAESSKRYFDSLGLQCPNSTNPADFFLRMIENQIDDSHASSDQDPDDDLDFYDAASKKEATKMVETALDAAKRKEYLKFKSSEESNVPEFSSSMLLPFLKVKEGDNRHSIFYEISVLGKRAFTNYWRQIETTAAQITQVVFCSLLVGLLFFDMGTNQNSITSRKGAIFEIMMNIFMLSFAAIACTFPSERPLFLKEKANNIYSTSTYFWSKVLLEFAFQSIWPILYIMIVYYMVGFQNSFSNLSWFLLTSVIIANVASAFALLLGSAVAIPEFTMQMVPFLVVPLTLFTAIMISEDSVPSYYIWMQWISPFHYAFEIYCIIEFSGLLFTCTDSEMVTNSDGDLTCAYSTGLSVLESLGIDPDDLSLDVACLFALMVVYLGVAYFILHRRKEKV